MSKLYESRKTNLSNPLTRYEIGYVFNCNNLNSITNTINQENYGSYLIGGIVGTGKSSLVDIASEYTSKKSLVIHVNFYNQKKAINEFSIIVMEHLINTIEKEIAEPNDELLKLIKECKLKLHHSIKEQLEINESTNRDKKENTKNSLFSEIHLKIKEVFNIGIKSEKNIENTAEENIVINKSISLNKIENDRIEDILNIIRQLKNINIIFIFDELDKMNINVLEKLFSKYKSIFVEKHIFNFFLVDDKMYVKYADSCNSKLFTYFFGKYYMPLLSFEETTRYCVMMFGEKEYLNCLTRYYDTLGNYRLLNINYKETKDLSKITLIKEDRVLDKITLIKSYILKKVIDNLDIIYLEKYYKDLIIKRIKLIIEQSIKIRKFSIEDFKNHLKKNKTIKNIWPQDYDLINMVIDVIKNICPEAIYIENNIININTTSLYNQHKLFRETALTDRKNGVNIENKYIDTIQFFDMYPSDLVKPNHSKSISSLHKDIILLKVDEYNPEAYEEVLINLIETNLDQQNIQVIILQKEKFKNHNEYTGIVVIQKGIFQIAYYVNGASYDSNSFRTKERLETVAQKYGIDIKTIKINNNMELSKNKFDIIDKYNAI